MIIIALDRDTFMSRLRAGWRLERYGAEFYYDPSRTLTPYERREDAVPGFMVREDGNTPEPIMGYWRIFSENRTPHFTVLHTGAIYRRS